jgi:hypothetical protein
MITSNTSRFTQYLTSSMLLRQRLPPNSATLRPVDVGNDEVGGGDEVSLLTEAATFGEAVAVAVFFFFPNI